MGYSPHFWGERQAEEEVRTHAYVLSAGLRREDKAGICQMRDESMTIAAANGSWRGIETSPAGAVAPIAMPMTKRARSQCGRHRLRHRAIAMRIVATATPPK